MANSYRRKGRYASDAPKEKRKAMPLLVLVAGIALLCLMGGILAKYIQTSDDPGNQVRAEDFYFTIDLFKVVDSEPENDDENKIVTRTFGLYGGGQNQLNFTVQNFFDELRVNAQEIAYTISYTTTDGLQAALTKDDAAVASGTSYTMTGSGAVAHKFNIKATSDPIPENSKMIVTVKTSKPYTKEMVLTVELHPQQYDVLYRVEDAVGQNHAKLVVMAGVAIDVDTTPIVIDWSTINASENALQIDTTDTDILGDDVALDGDNLPTTYLKTAKVVTDMAANESISIYFFKEDPSQDYSIPNTVVTKTNNQYVINITQ